MAELDRLSHIKLNLANLEYERHGSTREDIAWLIEQLEANRAEVGRLTSLLLHHNISPNDPGGRFHYAVIVAKSDIESSDRDSQWRPSWDAPGPDTP